jgi:hypothetical protein
VSENPSSATLYGDGLYINEKSCNSRKHDKSTNACYDTQFGVAPVFALWAIGSVLILQQDKADEVF